MPTINPFQDQKMRSTSTSNYGDEKHDLSKMFPSDMGISEMPMNDYQSKGYNATSDSSKGSN